VKVLRFFFILLEERAQRSLLNGNISTVRSVE